MGLAIDHCQIKRKFFAMLVLLLLLLALLCFEKLVQHADATKPGAHQDDLWLLAHQTKLAAASSTVYRSLVYAQQRGSNESAFVVSLLISHKVGTHPKAARKQAYRYVHTPCMKDRDLLFNASLPSRGVVLDES